jgi:hypothetical protein
VPALVLVRKVNLVLDLAPLPGSSPSARPIASPSSSPSAGPSGSFIIPAHEWTDESQFGLLQSVP